MDRREGVGREQLVHRLVMLVQAVCALFTLVLLAPAANATELTFEQIRYNGIVYSAFNENVVPQDYGDRVSGLSQLVPGGFFTYGNWGEGFTPNVEVAYGPYAESASVWWDNFGDLSHVLWTNVYAPFEITFIADPGFLVNLLSFDMSGWVKWDYIVGSIQVLDGMNNLLLDESNVHIDGDLDGPPHSHFDFSSLQAPTLRLRIDTTNLLTYFFNVGIDNIRFSQSEIGPSRAADVSTVPDPNTLLLLVVGLIVIRYWQRKI